MKITGITTKEFRWPRHKPIANGKHTYTHVTFAVVEIATTEGITGIGLGGGGEIERATIARLTPMLIGEDPIDVERLWQKMWEPKLIGRRGLTTRAISAIDIGLWDIRAKFANLPLYKLLGGFRDRVPTYIAGGYYEEGKGLRELAREMEDNVRMGAKAVKMKIGAVPIAEDVGAGACRARGGGAGREADGRRQLRLSLLRGDPAREAHRGIRHLLVRGTGGARRLRRPSQAGAGHQHSDRDRRERIHALRLPRPDQARLRGDPQCRRQDPRRRDRVHEGGGAGAGQRSGHRAARLAGHPRAPGRGDLRTA